MRPRKISRALPASCLVVGSCTTLPIFDLKLNLPNEFLSKMPDTIVTSLKLLIARLCSKTTKCKICGVIKKGPFFLRLHYKIMHKKEMLNDLLRIGTPINIGMFFLYIPYSSQCLLWALKGFKCALEELSRALKGSQGQSRALKGTKGLSVAIKKQSKSI